MEKVFLIDGNYWLFSSYYATAVTGQLMAYNGQATNAVFGFANRLESLIKQYHPDRLLVCFDAKGKTFRSELQEDYKANRKETPMELKSQFPMVREYLTARQIPWYEMEGWEGDDLIGTFASLASSQGKEVCVVTADKDMMQLVNDKVTIYKRNPKTKEDDLITPESFFEKYGLKPDQMKDLLGLMGDSADNIPGIKGVGEKTAIKLLQTYGSVEELANHVDEIKGKMGEKIKEGIQAAFDSKKIATIITDVPVNITLDDIIYHEVEDVSELRAFYEKYGMRSFLINLKNKEVKKQETKVEVVSTISSLKSPFSIYAGVYDQNYHKSIILGYGIYDGIHHYYISFEDAYKDESFKAILKDENVKKYGFNIKEVINASRWNGLEINGLVYDMQLACYVINPNFKDDMKEICDYFEHGDVEFEEEVLGKGAKKHIPEIEKQAAYYGKLAKEIYDLKPIIEKRLKDEQQYELYENIELPLTFILANMEFTGVKVNVETLKQQQKELLEKVNLLESDIYELAGKTFNISSPKQLGEVLFEDLKLPCEKKTKTGYSTAADVLEKLEPVHPIISKILEYRTLTKLYSTYLVGLVEQVFIDGKIHTMYNQALTQTGRLSSTDPNLQNIPIRYEEGKKIRRAFVPSFDYILSYDYSQIELRVVASLAGVDHLIDAFNNDIDIHTKTASDIFKVNVEDVTKDMRRQAKAINFGIIYGMSDFGLSSQIGVSVKEAKDFIKAYFTSYPQIKNYMDTQIKLCDENGYVTTMMNRRRYIPEIHESNFMRRELGKRLAMNSPIQGSAADLLKVAMIKVDELMKQHHVKSKMILQVHDELVFDVCEDELELMNEIVKKGMEECMTLNVKLKAEGCYGKTWYDLK